MMCTDLTIKLLSVSETTLAASAQICAALLAAVLIVVSLVEAGPAGQPRAWSLALEGRHAMSTLIVRLLWTFVPVAVFGTVLDLVAIVAPLRVLQALGLSLTLTAIVLFGTITLLTFRVLRQ